MDTIEEIKDALKNRDAFKMRKLSDSFTDKAVILQDEEMIDLAIITYSLNKIFSKVHFQSKFGSLITDSIEKLEKKDFAGIMQDIAEFDEKYGHFEGNLIKKARIKIGSRLYSHGLSVSRSASLVNVRISEILKYVGGTHVHESSATISVKDRLNVARKIFSQK